MLSSLAHPLARYESSPLLSCLCELIEASHAQLLYLPPYSPDLNPIEKAWSKFKQFLRAGNARSKEDLDQAISDALKTITTQNAAAWLRYCGARVRLLWNCSSVGVSRDNCVQVDASNSERRPRTKFIRT